MFTPKFKMYFMLVAIFVTNYYMIFGESATIEDIVHVAFILSKLIESEVTYGQIVRTREVCTQYSRADFQRILENILDRMHQHDQKMYIINNRLEILSRFDADIYSAVYEPRIQSMEIDTNSLDTNKNAIIRLIHSIRSEQNQISSQNLKNRSEQLNQQIQTLTDMITPIVQQIELLCR